MSEKQTAVLLFFPGAVFLLSGILLLVLDGFIPNITNISLIVSGLIVGVLGYGVRTNVKFSSVASLGFISFLMIYYGWLTIYNAHALVDTLLNGKLQLEPFDIVHQQANTFIFCLIACVVSLVISLFKLVTRSPNDENVN